MTPIPQKILDILQVGAAGHGRSQQRRIGPSEVGTPCQRQLAYKLLEAPQGATAFNDPLPSAVGTGAHAEMETFAHRTNMNLGWTRYLTEQTVTVREGLTGSCDLYDIQDQQVVDWKFVSTSRLAKYRKSPPDVYRVQAHLYGLGVVNAGFPVRSVAICFWPRGGLSKDAHWWTQPWDRQVALDALARIDDTLLHLDQLDAGAHPERIREGYGELPGIGYETSGCRLCPYKAFTTEPGPWQCDAGTTVPSPRGEVTQGVFAL